MASFRAAQTEARNRRSMLFRSGTERESRPSRESISTSLRNAINGSGTRSNTCDALMKSNSRPPS